MMTFTVIRIASVVIGIIGATYSIPIAVALFCGETEVIQSFLVPMLASVVIAFVCVFLGRGKKTRLSTRGAFSVVAVSWLSACFFGSIPLYASGAIPNFTNAVFESVSGFTTTGGTILSDAECLPRSINLWRCQMHWLGGMGIVALTVALLPLLGVGGFQMIKAETTGPEKGKLTPKITNTAKLLWFMYFGFTVVQTVLLMIAGMDFVDALSHSFSTLGTGGFSSKNASIGAYQSASIDIICTVFMFFAGVNFSLYYYILTGKVQDALRDSELRVYVGIVVLESLAIAFFESSTYGGFFSSLRYSSFQVLSVMSTTGYATADYTLWSPASQMLIFFLFFSGGCSGSTAGGVKVIRWTILAKQFHNEVQRMIHPHGVFTVRLNQKAGRKDVVFNVAAFIFIYIMMVLITTFITTLFGIDLFTSFTGALSMMGNVGPAFNKLGPSCNYGFLPDAVKWLYSFVMLAGRLEIYTMIIYFFPLYWKR